MADDDEEDWFESALEAEAEAAEDPDEEATGAGIDGDGESMDEAVTDAFDFDTGDGADPGTEDPLADDPSSDDPFADDGSPAPADGGPAPADEPAADSNPFDGDGAASPDTGPFADADDSGGFGAADGDDLFDQDFASALEGAGGAGAGGTGTGGMGEGGGFGFDVDGAGGGGGFDASEFADEAFESDIPRIELGIEGLDEMIQGGVPERSLMVVMGSAGTGKTTFGLQFLEHALANDESAVFITLEETRERILSTGTEKGWDFEAHEDAGRLAVVDLDPIEMANSLTSIRSELPTLVEEFGASRLVLDSVSLLEMMYDDQATRRSEVYDFTKSLKAAGVTTMLTSEASEDTPFASRYGIIEYLTDAVFVLRYVRPEDFRETRLAVEIQKIRDANHSRETKPYEITNSGISVYRQANIF